MAVPCAFAPLALIIAPSRGMAIIPILQRSKLKPRGSHSLKVPQQVCGGVRMSTPVHRGVLSTPVGVEGGRSLGFLRGSISCCGSWPQGVPTGEFGDGRGDKGGPPSLPDDSLSIFLHPAPSTSASERTMEEKPGQRRTG